MPNEERKYHSVKRSKKSSFVKGTGTGGAPHWRPDFRNKEVAVKSKLAIHDVKNEVSFSVCKYQPWYKNCKNHLEKEPIK